MPGDKETLEGIEEDGTIIEAEGGVLEEGSMGDVSMAIIAIVIPTLTLLRL
jgi:hypothetical protein